MIGLRVHVCEIPKGWRRAADYAASFGIRWNRFQSHPIGEQVWLLDCDPDTIPDPLPAGIELMKPCR